MICEFQNSPPLTWDEIPTSEGSTPVGHIRTFQWTIKACDNYHNGKDEAYFWLDYKGRDIAYVELVLIGEYHALHTAFILPEYQNKGLMSELVHWIIRDQGVALINDTQMTRAGLALWKSLMSRMDTSIIDISTGKKYGLDHPDTPEGDNAAPKAYNPLDGSGQRLFYLIEAPEMFHRIIEGVEYNFGCDIERHRYGKHSMLPPYFGDGDA